MTGDGQSSLSQPAASLAPAGWYRDPHNAAADRWWNGNDWTARTRPVRGSIWSTRRDIGAGKNSVALPALGCGILAIPLFLLPVWFRILDHVWTQTIAEIFAIAAIVGGSSAIHRARVTGVGRTTAIAGLSVGILSLVFGFGIAASLFPW